VVANELFPKGIPFLYDDYKNPFKFTCLLGKDNATSYREWNTLVSTNTNCSLTFEDDLLPAISRLAQRFMVVLKDKYLAGISRRNLISGLLW